MGTTQTCKGRRPADPSLVSKGWVLGFFQPQTTTWLTPPRPAAPAAQSPTPSSPASRTPNHKNSAGLVASLNHDFIHQPPRRDAKVKKHAPLKKRIRPGLVQYRLLPFPQLAVDSRHLFHRRLLAPPRNTSRSSPNTPWILPP